MRLKLDENLGRRASVTLRNGGHDVTTVVDQGLTGSPDRALIAACRYERRALVTLDVGFANPRVFDPADYSGIIVLRLPPRPTPTDLDDEIDTLLRGLTSHQVEGKLWIVQRGRIREHQPQDDISDAGAGPP